MVWEKASDIVCTSDGVTVSVHTASQKVNKKMEDVLFHSGQHAAV